MTDTSVHVHVNESPYDVVVGDGVLSRVGELLRPWTGATKAALITDSTVADRYGLLASAALARADFDVLDLAVPPGEASKSWSNAGELLEALADHGIGRSDIVIALGGGVVGDLAGFVAATYLRGIDFAQIPTTLLAMVDSSVGGKTAVDLRAGKNLAGAFKQPVAVLADVSLLDTLPDEEWRSGLAEVAKSAVIDSEEHLAWLEEHAAELVARDAEVVTEAVRRCVEFKSAVVSRDEKEEGPRECLNYGHTLGHAIEKVAGYGTVRHGAAAAEGMRFAARLSMELADAEAAFVKRQDRLLTSLGLTPLAMRLDPAAVLDAMRSDKKAREGSVRFVLAERPGEWRCEPVGDVTLSAHLEAWVSTKKESE